MRIINTNQKFFERIPVLISAADTYTNSKPLWRLYTQTWEACIRPNLPIPVIEDALIAGVQSERVSVDAGLRKMVSNVSAVILGPEFCWSEVDGWPCQGAVLVEVMSIRHVVTLWTITSLTPNLFTSTRTLALLSGLKAGVYFHRLRSMRADMAAYGWIGRFKCCVRLTPVVLGGLRTFQRQYCP